jgi:hypothetical protein
MQTTPKANNILGHFFALLGAVVMLAIATWVSASSSQQVEPLANLATPRTGHTATALSDGRILITPADATATGTSSPPRKFLIRRHKRHLRAARCTPRASIIARQF